MTKKQSLWLIFLSATSVVLILTQDCLAQSQGGGGGAYVGGVYGISVPDADNTKLHKFLGFTGGANITPAILIGGYYFATAEDTGSAIKFDYTLLGLEFSYNISPAPKNVFIGFRAGISKLETLVGATDFTLSPYHYGIVSGYNYFIWSHLSFGIEGSFMSFQTSKTTVGSETTTQNSFHIINFLVSFKLWF